MNHPTVKHYDQDTSFFETILDPYMKYSSGLFAHQSDSLETGIRQMLDIIIDKSCIEDASRALEIGPGWGSLIQRLTERKINPKYTGISPSGTQNNYIASKHSDFRKTILTQTFEQTTHVDNSYDVVFSIGSFCHLQDKANILREFARILKDGGRVIIEDTLYLSEQQKVSCQGKNEANYVQQDVFGFSEIESLPIFLQMVKDAGLNVEFELEHSESYKRTIRQWIGKINSNKFSTTDDKERARRLKVALYIGQRGWGETIGNFLFVLRKSK